MLFDPKWAHPPGVHSLDSLIAWLERQPADYSYNYLDSRSCLLAQYYTEMYGESVQVGARGDYRRASAGSYEVSPESFWRAAADIGCTSMKDWTFGGALKRAKALQGA